MCKSLKLYTTSFPVLQTQLHEIFLKFALKLRPSANSLKLSSCEEYLYLESYVDLVGEIARNSLLDLHCDVLFTSSLFTFWGGSVQLLTRLFGRNSDLQVSIRYKNLSKWIQSVHWEKIWAFVVKSSHTVTETTPFFCAELISGFPLPLQSAWHTARC